MVERAACPFRTVFFRRKGRKVRKGRDAIYCVRIVVERAACPFKDVRHAATTFDTRQPPLGRDEARPSLSPRLLVKETTKTTEYNLCVVSCCRFHILSLLFSLLKSKDDPQRGQGRRPHRKVPQRSVETVQLFNKLKSHSGVSLI